MSQMTEVFDANVIVTSHLHLGGNKGFTWESRMVLAHPQIVMEIWCKWVAEIFPVPPRRCSVWHTYEIYIIRSSIFALIFNSSSNLDHTVLPFVTVSILYSALQSTIKLTAIIVIKWELLGRNRKILVTQRGSVSLKLDSGLSWWFLWSVFLER